MSQSTARVLSCSSAYCQATHAAHKPVFLCHLLRNCLQCELDEVPLYVVVKEVLNKEAHVEAVEINYLTFYAFNGPYTIGFPPFAFEAGAHDGDWEHFTVRCAIWSCYICM